MEYTQNYHLPQWAEDDRIMLPDFNAAMAEIEGSLTAVRTEAAEGAQAAASQNCLVKLGAAQLGAGQSHTFQLPDLGTYSALVLQIAGAWNAQVFVNGDRGSNYRTDYGSSDQGFQLTEGSFCTLTLHPCGSMLGGSIQSESVNSNNASNSASAIGYTACGWSGLRSLLLTITSGGHAEVLLYAIRK